MLPHRRRGSAIVYASDRALDATALAIDLDRGPQPGAPTEEWLRRIVSRLRPALRDVVAYLEAARVDERQRWRTA